MSFSIPTNIVVYSLGCVAVVIVVGAISWTFITIERAIMRKREEKATRGE